MPAGFPDELAALIEEAGPEAVEALLEAMEKISVSELIPYRWAILANP